MSYLDTSGMEKRQFIRIPCRFPIKYYSSSDAVTEQKTYESKCSNLSIGGLMFLSKIKFKPYEEVHLEFSLSYEGKTEDMSVWGQVVWMEELGENALYSAGIKFQSLSEQDQNTLSTFVKSKLSQ